MTTKRNASGTSAASGATFSTDSARNEKNTSSTTSYAIPLIGIENNEFRVNPEAVEFLEKIDQPLAVLSAAGPYRTGKSFFLNKLVDCKRGQGFGVGNTSQACTKGLWMYLRTIECTNAETKEMYPCVVIDTEGIGSLDASSTHDTRIFCLALLLSSYFIYNSNGTIDETALSTLALVANMSEHVRVSSQNESKESVDAELGNYFPDFLWLVRNFSLIPTDEQGQLITSRTYLEQALRETELAPELLAKLSESDISQRTEKNRIRSLLRSFFPRRDCVTLVRPVDSERDLQNLDNVEDAKLRKEFKEQLQKVKTSIFTKIKPKTAMGRPLTGRLFAALCQSYADALNKGAAPVIKDSWAMLCEMQAKEAIEKAVAQWKVSFGQALKETTASGALPPWLLSETFASADQDAQRTFKKVAMGGAQDLLQYKEKLGTELLAQRQKAEARNERAIADFLAKRLTDMEADISRLGLRGELPCTVQNIKAAYDLVVSSFSSSFSSFSSSSSNMDFSNDEKEEDKTKRQEVYTWLEKTWAVLVLPKVWNWMFLSQSASEKWLDDAEQAKLVSKEARRELRVATERVAALEETLKQAQEQALFLRTENEKNTADFENLKAEMETTVKGDLTKKDAEIVSLTQEKAEIEAKLFMVLAKEEQGKDDERALAIKDAEIEALRLSLEDASARLAEANAQLEELRSLEYLLKNRDAEEREGQESANEALAEKDREIESLKKEMEEAQEYFTAQLRNMEKNFYTASEDARRAQAAEKEALSSSLAQKEKAFKVQEEKQAQKLAETESRLLQKEKELERAKGLEAELAAAGDAQRAKAAEAQKEISRIQLQQKVEIKEMNEKWAAELKEREAWEREFAAKKAEEVRDLLTKQKDVEALLKVAEIQNVSLKRRMEEYEDQPTAKKLKIELEKAQMDITRANTNKEWLEKRLSSQEKDIEAYQTKTKALEKEFRESNRQHDVEIMEMRIKYERKISALETQMHNNK